MTPMTTICIDFTIVLLHYTHSFYVSTAGRGYFLTFRFGREAPRFLFCRI